MPISLVSGGNLSGSAISGNNVTITLPTLQQNDVVYVVAGRVGGPTMSTAGYTQIGTVTSTTHVVRVFRKVMGATPDTTAVVAGSGNTLHAMAVSLFCLRGVDFNTPEDATPTTASGSSTNPNPPSITTVTNNAWVLAAASSAVLDTSVTAPTNYINLTNAGATDDNPSSSAMSSRLIATAGAEDPATYTSWSTGTWGAITVAVRPAIDSSNSVTGVSGTGAVGTVAVTLSPTAPLTGVEGTGQVGSVQVSLSPNIYPTGIFATGFVGNINVTSSPDVPATGLSATGFVGSVIISGTIETIYLTGVQGLGQVGSVALISSVSIPLTGVFATGYLNSVTIWIDSSPVQNPNWIDIDPNQVAGYNQIAPVQNPNWTTVVT